MDIFNNRELAVIFWFAIALIFVVFSKNTKGINKPFKPVVKMFFSRRIQSSIILMLFYIVAIVYILFSFDLWSTNQLKSTVTWTLSVGLTTLFSIGKIETDKHYFKNTIVNNFKIIAILEFIIGIKTYSLVTELIILPVVIILVLMIYIAERNKEHKSALTFLNNVLFLIVIIVFLNIYNTIYSKPTDFLNIQTMSNWLTPILLTISFIPFIFFMVVNSVYQRIGIRLMYLIKDKKIRFIAKVYALLIFNFRKELLKRWVASLSQVEIKSHKELVCSIQNVFIRIRAENAPRCHPNQPNWSPFHAIAFLQKLGVKTGLYHKSYDCWFASSHPKEFGQGIIPNNIAYYVEGNEKLADTLRLKLNVNNKKEKVEAHNSFLQHAKQLYKSATNTELEENLVTAIIDGLEVNSTINQFQIKIEIHEWPKGSIGGYDIEFTIKVL